MSLKNLRAKSDEALGVMIANVIWNSMNSDSGMSPDSVSRPTPPSMTLLRSPIQALPSPKARL